MANSKAFSWRQFRLIQPIPDFLADFDQNAVSGCVAKCQWTSPHSAFNLATF